MHLRRRHAFGRILLCASLLASAALATAPSRAVGSVGPQTPDLPTTWRDRPATPERMIERLEDAAESAEAYGPIPRAVLYDIGYPRSSDEYERLGGYAVVLVTAVSHDRSELPLARVYVREGPKRTELKLLRGGGVSENDGVSERVVKTFGGFRSDALYLMPVYLRTRPAELAVDYAKNRQGQKVGTFGTPLSAEVSALPIEPAAGSGPSDDAVRAFVKREFPGFVE